MSENLTLNMDNPQTLCVGVSLVIAALGIVLRKKIPIRTNCWFCNECFWMSYGSSNSWTCKKCEQYNGFTPDGGYNKKIDTKTPRMVNYTKNVQYLSSNSNGLCRKCNANQHLKIMQLASFVPMNENKFDAEIEAYKIHLEKLYQLCPMCRRFLKNKLALEKSLHLNTKLINHRWKVRNDSKGSDILVKIKEYVSFLLKLITISLFIIIVVDIAIHLELFLSKQVIYATKRYFYNTFTILSTKLKQNEYFENATKLIYFDNIVQIEEIKQNLINTTSKYFQYVAIEPSVVAKNLPLVISYLSVAGFCLQIVRNFVDFKFTCKHFFKFALWTWINYNASNSIRYLDLLQVCLLSMLLICGDSDDDKIKKPKAKNNLKNLSTPIENDDDLDQSDSDNDDYFECSKFNNTFDNVKHPTMSARDNDNPSLHYGWNVGNHPFVNMPMPRPSVVNGSIRNNNSELDKCIKYLSIGQLNRNDKDFVFTTRKYKCSSPNLFMPSPSGRSIISPGRLVHGAQQSWVAGGYWGSESPRKMYNSRNESSSSSQSSGFESFTSNMRNNMSSFPPSRDDSICSENVESEGSKLNNTMHSFQSFCSNAKQNEPARSSCVPYTEFNNYSMDVFNNLRLNNNNSFVPLQRPTSIVRNSCSFS